MTHTQTKNNQINIILSSNPKHNNQNQNHYHNNNNNNIINDSNIPEFIKSTFASSNLNSNIEWIWGEEKEKDSRVNHLFSICDSSLNSLYECEMKYGSNSDKCASKLSTYNQCLQQQICPQEFYLKEIFCFGKTNLYDGNIKIPPSTLNQLNEADKNHLCSEFTKELKSCVSASLSKIWS